MTFGGSPWFLIRNAPYVLSDRDAFDISASVPQLNSSKSTAGNSLLEAWAQLRGDEARMFDMASDQASKRRRCKMKGTLGVLF